MASVGSSFTSRPFASPAPDDTLATLAARLLPARDDAAEVLLSWNPHLAVRLTPLDVPGGLLPTDIVYTAPPASAPPA
jgi:hypothetical protein